MGAGSATPFFCLSRSPAEALLLEADHDERWGGWARHGLRTLERFLRDLERLPQVDYTDLRIDPRRFRDAAGTDFTCAVSIDVKFTRLPLIQANGYGYGASLREARLTALAESLERLGFCLRGWYDAASRAKSDALFERLAATDNTNGACFHSSPVRALKGSFCELLERDAFLAAWYSNRPLPVSPISQGHRLYPWARRFAAEDWELREHRWLHDRVPAVVVGLSLTRNAPAKDQWNFFFGSAAAPIADEAQDKALNEVLKSRRQASCWSVGTSGRATPAQLRSVESRRILYQRPAFVRKFTERLALRSSAPVHARASLSDRDFVTECFRALRSAKVVPLLLPAPFSDTTYCVQVVCDELQGLDWRTPPHYNLPRIHALYGTRPASLCRLPHPLA